MLYGHHKIYLRKVLNKNFSYFTYNRAVLRRVVIDHGMLFGDKLHEGDFAGEIVLSKYYTYGPKRVEVINNWLVNNHITGITVHSLGNYIKYARPFYDEAKLAKLKKQLGRVLLVIPSHTVVGIEHKFDENAFMKEIALHKDDFDTVLVCVYWKDILENKHIAYLQSGYKVVCAGYNADPFFLGRLRNLFELCEMSMSNQLGTHIGYSIGLNRPHYLFYQSHSYSGRNLENERIFVDINRIKELEINKFMALFGAYSMDITNEQRNFVSEYWGE
jgi:hypothetical protein